MKKLILLFALLFTISIGYCQDNIKMSFYQKQLKVGDKLGVSETTSIAFIKNYIEKNRENEIHYHDDDLDICKTYYIYSEGDIIKYDSRLEYSEAKASTNKNFPNEGEQITFVLWRDYISNKLAISINRDSITYMYYVDKIEIQENGISDSQSLTKW